MIGSRLRNLLLARESPHRTALAFGIGVFVGVSPLLGIHTLLGLLLASVFRLNRVVTLTGVYVTNPWTIVPIYAFCTWAGALILGVEDSLSVIDWHNIKLSTIGDELGALFMPFLTGSTVVAVAAGVLSYFIVKKVLEKTRRNPAKTETGDEA